MTIPRHRSGPFLATAVRRDRAVVLGCLLLLSALAWAYLVHDARRMTSMEMHTGTSALGEIVLQPWHAADLLLLYAMWAIMMVGMMVPTAAPTLLLFARVSRKRREEQRPYAPTGAFLLGYVAAWSGFSMVAAAVQAGLHDAALLSTAMASTSPLLGGPILIAAGMFQWTPLKSRCLVQCRAPHSFLAAHWREGTAGALHMGLRHGLYCVGCCWVLMALLFVTGVMNLLWVAVITAFVLLEKAAPRAMSAWLTRGAGVALAAWGLAQLA